MKKFKKVVPSISGTVTGVRTFELKNVQVSCFGGKGTVKAELGLKADIVIKSHVTVPRLLSFIFEDEVIWSYQTSRGGSEIHELSANFDCCPSN